MTSSLNPTFAPGQKIRCVSIGNIQSDWLTARITYPEVGKVYTVIKSMEQNVDSGRQEFCYVEETISYFDVRDFEPEGMATSQLDAYDRAMSIL